MAVVSSCRLRLPAISRRSTNAARSLPGHGAVGCHPASASESPSVVQPFAHLSLRATNLGQTVLGDHRARGVDQCLLENAFQLAHVAGPVVVLQHLHRLGLDLRDALAHARVVHRQKVIDQQIQITLAIAQRRQADQKALQPVQQILAKLLFAHQRVQVAVRGGNDPHVGREWSGCRRRVRTSAPAAGAAFCSAATPACRRSRPERWCRLSIARTCRCAANRRP